MHLLVKFMIRKDQIKSFRASIFIQMSNPKKQHFVPKVYLKRFAFNRTGEIYALKIKSKYPNIKVKKVNISQICYSPDLYTIKTTDVFKGEEFVDNYILEKELFDYEETFLNEVLNKLELRQNINSVDSERLIVTLINFKHRNRLVFDILKNKGVLKFFLGRELERIKRKNEKFEKKYGKENVESLMKLIEIASLKRMENEGYISDIINHSLEQLTKGKLNNHNWLIKQMARSKIFVYCTSPDYPFITSDNPGFSVDQNEAVHNMNYYNAIAMGFPISPTRLLVIRPDELDPYTPIIKEVKYINANKEFVHLSNQATINTSIESIYSGNKDILLSINQNK